MALQINYTDDSGIAHTTCYCKIDRINVSYKEEQTDPPSDPTINLMTLVHFYHTKDSRDNNLKPFLTIPYVKKDFDEDSLGTGSLRNLIYTYLKTLTILSSATDV